MNDLMRQVLMQQAMDHGTLHNAGPGATVAGAVGGGLAGAMLAPHSTDTTEVQREIKGGRTMEPIESAGAIKGMGHTGRRLAGGLVGAIAGGLLGKPLQGALVAQTAGPNRAAEILGRYDTQGGVTERDLAYLQSLMTERYANAELGMPLRGL